MRIDRLVLEAFGAFRGKVFNFVPGFNVFFGLNEEGKSTLIDGLLLALVGAPVNAPVRQRYLPLTGGAYRVTIFFTAVDGSSFRVERDLGADGGERIYLREGEVWLTGRKVAMAWKMLDLPSFDLARATVVISGSEVVLAGREAGAVSRAISARVAGGTTSGRQAKNRLDERRRSLENKERRDLEDQLRRFRLRAEAIRTAEETRRRLEEEWRRAGEELEWARARYGTYRPAVEAWEAFLAAKENYDRIAERHAAVFSDLRAICHYEEEITRLEEELARFLPCGEYFTEEAKAAIRRLAGAVEAARETAAKSRIERLRLEEEAARLRARLLQAREAGFTSERARELDRAEAAVTLAAKNAAEKEEALTRLEKDKTGFSAVFLAGCSLLAGAGLVLATGWRWLGGGFLLLAAVAAGWWFLLRLQQRARKEALSRAKKEAEKELAMARTVFLTLSGGREMAAWQEEYTQILRMAEELREKEARIEVLATADTGLQEQEAELGRLLAAAGCRDMADYEDKVARLEGLRRRLAECQAARDSLLRKKDKKAWEEEELTLARQEAVAKAALLEAEKKAAGLDPATVARYQEELAGIDLAALERRFLEAKTAYEQHLKSTMIDAWEVETEITLLEEALAHNERRARALRLAMEVLDEALAEVQTALVPRIRELAGGFFRDLTGGRYDGLEITSGAELLEVAPCRQGEILPPRILSSGTTDQMYLALRLALGEVLAGSEPLPLIFDDPFLTFDRVRLERAVDLLGRLATGRQIILVTKDEFLRDLALAHGAVVLGECGETVMR